jgi:hypothetical protein
VVAARLEDSTLTISKVLLFICNSAPQNLSHCHKNSQIEQREYSEDMAKKSIIDIRSMFLAIQKFLNSLISRGKYWSLQCIIINLILTILACSSHNITITVTFTASNGQCWG